MGKGAKTKGWIKNNVTGVKKSFQYNPTTLTYSRGSTFSEIVSPGMAYPITQFVHGNLREFPVEFYLFDAPKSSGVIKEYMNFFGDFLTPETNEKGYTKPPDMTFCYGFWIRKCVCVKIEITLDSLDEDGEPIESHFTMTLRQVGV